MKTDNEVLAEFDKLPPMYEDGTGYVHKDEDGTTWGYYAEELEYDKKFSWLMPVWYKFKELKNPVDSSITEGRFINISKELKRDIEHAILHEGCSAACRLLAKGIRWYNETVKK